MGKCANLGRVVFLIQTSRFFQLDLNEEVFTAFTEQLVSDSSKFTKSVKFAKMMLTVLTKYSNHVRFKVLVVY